jgi:hypothetical protein
MEDIVETKGIEKIPVEPETNLEVKEIEEKPKRKPRSEAQKAAFEKARLKRAENLAKKKLEEEDSEPDLSNQIHCSASSVKGGVSANSTEVSAKPKSRGRPKGSKKLKREPEPIQGQPNFLPQNIPPQAGDIRYQYHQPNPYQYHPFIQQQYQPPPQIHNYYYGHQQGAVHQQPREHPPPQRPPTPESESSSEEELEFVEQEYQYLPPPTLKYRFA